MQTTTENLARMQRVQTTINAERVLRDAALDRFTQDHQQYAPFVKNLDLAVKQLMDVELLLRTLRHDLKTQSFENTITGVDPIVLNSQMQGIVNLTTRLLEYHIEMKRLLNLT